MLDADTKRRIDTARDILVGKVPDPKSQVEQITIALIYKFMDDIDATSEELGGKRSFFAAEFARYGWARLMQPGLGGHEMLNLYAEAIERMDQNAAIPQLFRDIFSNAFLPYRDPETLRAFLKQIDGFTYDHSERLGDAFEYLLSVMDSQGDAGQFRTPRHIINFMVEIVDPKKDDVVLDPACGTAGFLISSYKHILAANIDADSNSALTPDEKRQLARNFKGYDISPDMVRLSLVNMYLHDFVAPQIVEYDTLTSDERWNEYADVILANPPFMSPKGGGSIRPHSRFSVNSKRSEVLFVDYIAEHMTAGGRAGIIVPEGIIFQSQNAYKQLRKKLVEDFLVAVVSLPAGVFNPYSGVKTSILLLDKALARKTDRIAFFKVENDGFGLGAQRRPIDKNDLPQVGAEIAAYMQRLRAEQAGGEVRPAETALVAENRAEYAGGDSQPSLGLIAAKERVAADGEYNLSGERYRETTNLVSSFPIVALGDVAEIIAGQSPPGVSYNEEGIGTPFYQGKTEFGEMCIGEPVKWTTDPRRIVDEFDILMSVRAPVGPINFATQRICIGRGLAAIRPLGGRLHTTFAFYVLRGMESKITGNAGAAFASINKGDIQQIRIPLPPLDVQQEIVAEIEGYQKVIDGARAVVENYRPHIHIDPDWPIAEVRDVCIVNPKKSEIAAMNGATSVSFVPMSDMGENTMYFEPKDCKVLKDMGTSYTYFRDNDVLIAKVTPCFENGKAGIAKGLRNGIGFGSSEFYVLRPTKEVLPNWVFLCVATPTFRKWATPQMTGTGGLQRVPKTVLESYTIPLPALNIQQQIVAEIEDEHVIIDANDELIERLEKRIRDAIAQVWEN